MEILVFNLFLDVCCQKCCIGARYYSLDVFSEHVTNACYRHCLALGYVGKPGPIDETNQSWQGRGDEAKVNGLSLISKSQLLTHQTMFCYRFLSDMLYFEICVF